MSQENQNKILGIRFVAIGMTHITLFVFEAILKKHYFAHIYGIQLFDTEKS